MFENNFFSSLGIADIERIHTQFLFWFFNSINIPDKIKSDLLLEIIDDLSFENEDINNFQAETEFNDIDLVIRTNKIILYLENKIKSLEHFSGKTNKMQTYAYDDIIEKQIHSAQQKNIFRCFLTLFGENPASEKWFSLKYSDLLNAFNNIDLEVLDAKEKIFVNEYKSCINDLSLAYNIFIHEIYNFSNVFRQSYDINIIESEQIKNTYDYITRNKLETIFQIGFFYEVINKLSNLFKNDNIILYKHEYSKDDDFNFPNIKNKQYNYNIDESQGIVLIHIDITYFKYKNMVYQIGFQYQDGTSKINCSRPGYLYSKSKSQEIGFASKIFQNNVIFKKYSKPNPPRTKAYISRSCKSVSLPCESKNDISQFTYNLYNEIKNAIEIVDNIKHSLKNEYKEIIFI